MPSIAQVYERSRLYVRGSDFVSKVTQTFVTKAALFGISMGISILVSRELGPINRGIYATALAITGLGVQFGNFGLHASNTFYVAKNRDLAKTLISNTLILSLAAGSVIGVITLILLFLRPNLLPLHGANLALAAVGIPIGLSYLLFQNLLIGQYRISAYNSIEIINRIANLGLLVLIWRVAALSSAKAVLANVLAVIFGTVFCLYVLISESGFGRFSLRLFKETFSYGFRSYLCSFFTFVVLRADLLMVGHMLGAEQTGYYSIAVNMADLMIAVPTAISTILFPKFSAMKDDAEKRRQAGKVLVVLGGVMGGMAVLAVLAAPFFIPLLFGARFAAAVPAFRLLTPGVVFISLTSVLSAYVASEYIPWSMVGIYVVMSGVNIGLNLIWLRRLGIGGASIASSICYLGCFLGLLIISLGRNSEAEKRPVL
jgi:O-antigen/teichoic acid export membrane protein